MWKRWMVATGLVVVVGWGAGSAQDSRGRKYKAPPETSHIEVMVLKDTNSKPVVSAAVVFHSTKDGHDEGNLEVKTNDQGRAQIDVIPTGSSVDVQVIADGFATFAGTYQVNEATRAIEVRMIKPRAQVSTYVDTRGQAAQRPPGLQEAVRPVTPSVVEAPKATNHTSDAAPLAPGAVNDSPGGLTVTPGQVSEKKPGIPVNTSPANMHPDNQYGVDPAVPAKTPVTNPPATPPNGGVE